jgi:protein BCP1
VKKARVDSDGKTEANNGDDDDGDDSDDAKEINVQFDIFDPVPSDFHTIKIMCKQYGETEEFDLSGFADLITEQIEVGSMIKVITLA